MMWYHAFRILAGEARQITYAFFVCGHGHNPVDGCFGCTKKVVRNSTVYSMDELLQTLKESTSYQTFEQIPDTDLICWKEELAKIFLPIPNITKYSIFEFFPGENTVYVYLRRRLNDDPVIFELLQPQHRGNPNLKSSVLLPLMTRQLPKQPIKGMAKKSWSMVKKSLLKMVPERYQAELIPPDDVMIGTEEGIARQQKEREAALAGASRSQARQMQQISVAAPVAKVLALAIAEKVDVLWKANERWCTVTLCRCKFLIFTVNPLMCVQNRNKIKK